ncbi:Phage Gp37Gp68 [Trichormus variabilis ATCC 29413]|uniref:Phage Gp37Gp68 n=2 Tax=Anabaena variabilis TaxID=264691 RepID=Q3MGU0_TRIV2|nr:MULTISPECIES: phage Gp37/Gp68 family protein [Nostocaceae]ABA19796.1 Phage Gp37Gp68 [Trichormus variabilis ATCC 29413]MBC1215623.1 phage Gp37/Gp68 family protein [Trichormus variabilis ARAD]MBC1255578.1 phage Gp37/Gp68 family protein [Trichormus variabilis V5]MBC1269026.1 phage Gp37/Gp68 family protein [Trichormus variabilis FSR]MBC1304220.1 phage Gp37/Gp68 family protein [Trichormus variabilis N2B]
MSSTHTGIEWTDKTWNPTTGCDKVSPGCRYCYAEALTERFPQSFPTGFKLNLHPERLEQPKRWRTPSRIFVNSMSDLFHEDVPFSFLQEIFSIMRETPWHIYQILTKREENLVDLAPKLEWTENIWMGVSVESQRYTYRIDALRKVPAAVRFLSCEPLLESLNLDLQNIDWVIVGGESGYNHRPVKPEWIREILQQTREAEVAFFFKQWGGKHSKAGGRMLDDHTWEEMPKAWRKHIIKWQKKFHGQPKLHELEQKYLMSTK